jgi:protein-S-isoprenylcysteine O-methyltransferase Ste14
MSTVDRVDSLSSVNSVMRTIGHFFAWRRIWMTLCLLLAADAVAGTLSNYDLTNLREVAALAGLASILIGLTSFLNAAEQRLNQAQLADGRRSNANVDVHVSAFAIVVGFCSFAVNPKNGWFVLAPFFLLYVRRVWQAECQVLPQHPPRWFTMLQLVSYNSDRNADECAGLKAKGLTSRRVHPWRARMPGRLTQHDKLLLRSRRYAPMLMFPLIGLALIGFDWPFDSYEFHQIWEMYCLALSFLGLAIRAAAGGNALHDGLQAQSVARRVRPLNTSGMYSIVRHPRYVGDFFIGLGIVLVPFVVWLPLVYSAAFCLYYARVINVDEKLLRAKAGSSFDRWASNTPAYFFRIRKWRPSEYPFSFRSFLLREHKGIILIIAMHSSIEWGEHWILEQRILTEAFWILLVAFGFAIYVYAKVLERYSPSLNAATRKLRATGANP